MSRSPTTRPVVRPRKAPHHRAAPSSPHPPGGLSGPVDALVARGLVRRSPDPADRRSWLLSLTKQGHQVTTQLLDHTITERQLVFAGFTDNELDALATALDRIDANLRTLLSSSTPP